MPLNRQTKPNHSLSFSFSSFSQQIKKKKIWFYYSIGKKRQWKTEPFFIIAKNFNEISTALDTHRKWLFSLIIIVKVPLVVAKSHIFLVLDLIY